MNIRVFKTLSPDSDEEWTEGEMVEDRESWIVTLGDYVPYETADGRIIVEKDYRIGGEVWQVHKFDADPFPSRPHAHCIAGRTRYVGCKLHLGTRQLWNGRRPMEEFLPKKPFRRLIEMIRPKFPNIVLPLPEA